MDYHIYLMMAKRLLERKSSEHFNDVAYGSLSVQMVRSRIGYDYNDQEVLFKFICNFSRLFTIDTIILNSQNFLKY